MWQKRRLHPRVAVELPAEYRIEPSLRKLEGTITNLSAGGAAVRTGQQIPPRALIHQFRFSLATEGGPAEPLEASAVLIHAHPYRNDDGEIAYFSGLHFLGLQDAHFEHLRDFLRDRLRPPSDDLA